MDIAAAFLPFLRRLGLRAGVAALLAFVAFGALTLSAPVAPEPLQALSGTQTALAGCSDGDSIDSGIMAQDGNQSWTRSTVVSVYATRGMYEVSSSYCTNFYWYLVVVTGHHTAAEVRGGGGCGIAHYIGGQGWMGGLGYTYPVWNFNFNALVGGSPCENAWQGGHGVTIGLMTCTAYVGDSPYTWGPAGWLSARTGCTAIVAVDQDTINYDTAAPSAPWISPGGATVTGSTSYNFDWTISDPAPSSGYSQSRLVIQRASISGPGTCGSNWGDQWYPGYMGAGNYVQSGLMDNSCFRAGVQVADGVGNWSPAWSWSPTILVDTSNPTTSWVTPNAATIQDETSINYDWAFSDVWNGSGYSQSRLVIQRASIASPGTCGSNWGDQWYPGYMTAGSYLQSGLFNGYCFRAGAIVQDRAGNWSNNGNWTFSPTSLIDTSSPSISFVPSVPAGPGNWWTNGVDVDINVSDTASGLSSARYRINGGSWVSPGSLPVGTGSWSDEVTFSTPGTYLIEVESADRADNARSSAYTVNVDATAPELSYVTPPSGQQFGNATSQQVVWTETEPGAPIISRSTQMYRRLPVGGNCENPMSTWQAIGSPSSAVSGFTSGGLVSGYCYQWQTTLENAAGLSAVATSGALLVDSGDPLSQVVISSDSEGENGWHVAPPTVTIFAMDALSGIDYLEFQLGTAGNDPSFCTAAGGSVVGGWCRVDDSTLELTVPVDGEYTLVYRGVDNAGNIESSKTLPINVDATTPGGSLAVDDDSGTTQSRTVDATALASDETSGIWKIRFGVDVDYDWSSDAGWTTWDGSGEMVKSVSLESGQGTYLVRAQVMDYAGNVTFLDDMTTLESETVYPTFAAAALVYDCADPQAAPLQNDRGVVYWSVDRPLCLAPQARVIDGGSKPNPSGGTLSARIVDPVVSYILRSDPNDPTRAGVIWPASVGQQRSPAESGDYSPGWTRFRFTRETSGLDNSVPYVSIPMRITVQIAWFDAGGNQVGPAETLSPNVELRVIASNSGQTR